MPADLAELIFEDEALAAFNKPSGVLVAPDRWKPDRPCLCTWIRERHGPTWVNVHSLDAETSGLVLFAKTPTALGNLSRQLERRTAHKEYVALVRGHPEPAAGEIRMKIAADPANPGRSRVHRSGREALTEYQTLETWMRLAWVRLIPRTSRMHQLRVHLAHLHCPILCDGVYGRAAPLYLSLFKRRYKPTREAERPLLARLALHAERIVFAHPVTTAPTEIVAPLAHDLEVALKLLRKFARP